MIAKLAGMIGDPAVRHMGTIGGSIANNDPTADYPAACLALGATIITNKRRIKADDFFTGMFSTALEPTEIITKVSFPLPKKAAYKIPQPGVALRAGRRIRRQARQRNSRRGHWRRRQGVFRVTAFEEALKKRFAPKSLEGLTVSADGLNSDIHGSAEYRAHLIGVLARRAVAEAVGSSYQKRDLSIVIPGHRDRPFGANVLPGIQSLHAGTRGMRQDVDCRDKPGNDGID